MKITCPKCHATYRIDLPDPRAASIDVQCGKCLYIFQFSADSDLPEDRSSEPILPPQMDEDQEVSDSKKQPPSSLEEDREIPEELELEPVLDDSEPIEIIIENEVPEDSLEKEALEDIWDQAVQEGARTIKKSKEKSPTPPSGEPVTETVDRETLEETLLADKSQPPPSRKDPQQEKPQEEIDLEEQVTIDEGEAMLGWEEAFAHQAEVESGWRKAQEQDRIQEEQQLAEALSKKALPSEPATEEKAATAPQGDTQSLVDKIFAEVKGSQEPQKETAKSPQPQSKADQKPDEVGQIFSEAKNQQEEPQEGTDLEEQVIADQEEAIPSWEEAFAHQSEVEAGWKKALQEDRIHEEQQLADALGETYETSDTPAEDTATTDPQEDNQNLVDQLFAEVQSQQENLEPPKAKKQDEPQNVSGERAPSSEIEETHVDQHTIPGAIDLMTDLDDLNMKQMVTQAFREESEPQEKAKLPPPDAMGDEVAQELELTMESPAKTPQEAKPPSEDLIPELGMGSILERALESSEKELEPLETFAQLEEPRILAEVELEPIPEKAEAPAEPETAISDASIEMEAPLEMESEHEPTMEAHEAIATSAAQPATGQESLYDKEREGIWNDLLPGNDEEGPPVNEESPIAFAEEAEKEEPFGGSDFWDQVLEKDSQESQTSEIEAEPQPVSVPVAQDTAESEALTDEELWKQAFPGEEELEPTTSQTSSGKPEDPKTKVPPLIIEANVNLNEETEDSPEYDEAAYADYDDDELEFQPRKRKLGPFTIPRGRHGDLVIGGAMVVFLLLAGSVYFTLETFAPDELTDIQTAKTEVPEGLTPREVPLDELAGDLTSAKPPKTEKTQPVDPPGDKGEATLSDPAKILEESPEEKGILKDLAESQILKDTGKAQAAKIEQSALQGLTGHSVTMSTIMPVAYNPTDIRVLSFSVEIQLSNAQSAKRVRGSLPVYEEIMNKTVEDFLRRKFYNDILYVKEKLQKRLQTAMNKSLKNGRVRKTKFTEFAIQ
jgi:predicted Zn finger-like uncharacterized protein